MPSLPPSSQPKTVQRRKPAAKKTPPKKQSPKKTRFSEIVLWTLVVGVGFFCVHLALLWNNKQGGLGAALKRHDFITAQIALRMGADINAYADQNNDTYFYLSCYYKDPKALDFIITHGGDPNIRNIYEDSPLMHAVHENYMPCIQASLAAGADVNLKDKEGHTPLAWAVNKGYTDLISILINAGARDSSDELFAAIQGNKKELVKSLLQGGADYSQYDEKGNTPLSWAAYKEYWEIFQMLLDAGVDIERGNNYEEKNGNRFGETVLISAAIKGRKDIVEYILASGADVDGVDKDGDTALMEVARQGNINIMDVLLAAGAEINRGNQHGVTALATANNFEQPEAVKYLISKGADIHLPDNTGDTPLIEAAASGDVLLVKILLAAGALPDVANLDSMTPLAVACLNSRPDIIRLLLKEDIEIDRRRRGDGRTAMAFAAQKGCLECVKILHEAGSDIETKDNKGKTPLMLAVRKGHYEATRYLLSVGANVKALDESGGSLLMTAMHGGDPIIIKMILQAGVDINQPNDYGHTPLTVAAQLPDRENIVKLLLDLGANLEYKAGKNKNTALIVAGDRNLVENMKVLMAAGADIETKNVFGSTPFVMAASYEMPDAMRLLIEAGADIDHIENDGDTALLVATYHRDTEVIKILLEAGANTNLINEQGQTALINAVMNEDLEMVKMLLDAGADINQRGGGKSKLNGHTPLMLSAGLNIFEGVQLLLEKGADVTLTNEDGWTALHHAAHNPMEDAPEVAMMLIKAGADVNALSVETGVTPLHLSVLRENYNIAKSLIEAKAELDVADKNGMTPLMSAALEADGEMVLLLLTAGADVHKRSNDDWTAMDYAKKGRNLQIMSVLKTFSEKSL